MTKPTIHSNGTSRRMLTEGYCDAYTALQTALDALKQTAPNGRDYYPQGPDATQQADTEHMARIKKIRDVMAELEELAIYCDQES